MWASHESILRHPVLACVGGPAHCGPNDARKSGFHSRILASSLRPRHCEKGLLRDGWAGLVVPQKDALQQQQKSLGLKGHKIGLFRSVARGAESEAIQV